MNEIEPRNVVHCAHVNDGLFGDTDRAYVESTDSAECSTVRRMLSGLERNLEAWVRQLSRAESHYALAFASIGELLDVSQASIIRAQEHLQPSDPVGQDALTMMMICADRLHHTAHHFQRQSRDLASVGGILRLMSQTIAAMRQRDPATLAIITSTTGGFDEILGPADMTTRLHRLRLEAEQLALGRKTVSLRQVMESIVHIQAAMETLLKPAADDFVELEACLAEIEKQHLIVKQHLIGE